MAHLLTNNVRRSPNDKWPLAQYLRMSITVPFGTINWTGPGPACPHAKVAFAQTSNHASGSRAAFLSSGTPFSQRPFAQRPAPRMRRGDGRALSLSVTNKWALALRERSEGLLARHFSQDLIEIAPIF
jgi:hypothetical protein